MKPGYKTTEFWLSFLAVIVGALICSGAFDSGTASQILGGVAFVLGALGYTVPRSLGKTAEIKAQGAAQAAMAVQQLVDIQRVSGWASNNPMTTTPDAAERIARPSTR